MRIIRLCVHADRSASLTSLTSLKKFFLSACKHAQAGNTWDYGKSHRPPPKRLPPIKEITFDPSYSLSQRLIRLRWELI